MNSVWSSLDQLEPADESFRKLAQDRLQALAIPSGALGRLSELAVDLAGMTRSLTPSVTNKMMLIGIGDHGWVNSQVTSQPKELTAQLVRNMVAGKAPVSAYARVNGVKLRFADWGSSLDADEFSGIEFLDRRKIGEGGTRDSTSNSVMTAEEVSTVLDSGFSYAQSNSAEDIFSAGVVGVGNDLSSVALLSVVFGVDPAELISVDKQCSEERRAIQEGLIRKAMESNAPDPEDPVDLLAKLGGVAIAGITGFILGVAVQRKPLVVGGLASMTAALLATKLQPRVKDYLILADGGQHPAGQLVMDFLGERPLLDLGLGSEAGESAILLMPILEAACRVFTQVPLFKDSGINAKGVLGMDFRDSNRR